MRRRCGGRGIRGEVRGGVATLKGCLGLFSALFGSVSFRFLTGHLKGDLHGVRRCIFDLDLLPFTLVEQLLGQTSTFLVLATLLSSLTFDFELSGFSTSFTFTAFTRSNFLLAFQLGGVMTDVVWFFVGDILVCAVLQETVNRRYGEGRTVEIGVRVVKLGYGSLERAEITAAKFHEGADTTEEKIYNNVVEMFGVNGGLEVDRVVPLKVFVKLSKDEGTVTAVTDEGMGLLVMVEVTVSAVMYIVAVATIVNRTDPIAFIRHFWFSL